MRLITETFETWPPRLEQSGSPAQDTSTAPLLGSASARLEESGDYFDYPLSGALDRTYYLRAGIRVTDEEPGSNMALMQAYSNVTGTLLQIYLVEWGELTLWNDEAGENLDNSGVGLTANVWYQLELKVHVPAAGPGAAAYRLHSADGELLYDSGDLEANIGNAAINFLAAGRISGGSGLVHADEVAVNDDTAISSNSWPGPALPPAPTVLWGALMSGDHYNPGWDKAPYEVETWDTFEANAGRRVGIVHAGDPWLTWDGFGAGATSLVSSRAARPLKSLGASGAEDPLGEVLAGEHDAEIDAWAAAAKAHGGIVYLRPWWEMNGTWFPWGRHASYVAAWQYLHARIKAIAPNVEFVWCANTIWEDPESDPGPWYPGDAYVDWTGLDGYTGRNPAKDLGWFSANVLLVPTYERLREIAPTKPVMICETGCSEYGPEGEVDGSKAVWLTELLRTTIPHNMPEVQGLCYFNWEIEEGEPAGSKLDWPIESSPEAQAAFAAEIASAYYYAPPGLTVRRTRKPPLELDVEIETAEGTIVPLSAENLRAANIPTGITFGTQRGDGFGTGGFNLARQILREYPDLNLLDTVRFIGRQGEIAYEGRFHSNPRGNDPMHSIQVALVGWMTYLKSRPCSPLIIDRRLGSWGDMSLQHEGALLSGGFLPKQFPASQGDEGSGAGGPGIVFSCSRLVGTYLDAGQQWLYAGGEDIAALRYSFEGHGLDTDWLDQGGLCADDVASGFVGGTDHNGVTTANQEVLAGDPGKKHAVITTVYGGASTGDTNITHRWRHPRIVGTHGLPEIGTRPEEGYAITDIGEYVLNTYYPKIDTSEIDRNTFALQQATWHDVDADGYTILQQLNDLILWETNVWEERKLHWHNADLSNYDWLFRTDDPGVTVLFQGDSIENFANGIVITYTDFWGKPHKLYPSDFAELRDESEDNPASRHGEDLWTSQTVPWPCELAEALQYGRAYLAEFNRPKRPGVYRIAGGYLMDAAGHWRQGWAVRNSQTVGILDHPQDFPRLITATGWSQDGLSLDVTVDAPPMTITAISARHEQALAARNQR